MRQQTSTGIWHRIFTGILVVFLISFPVKAEETLKETREGILYLEQKLQNASGQEKMQILFHLINKTKQVKLDKSIAYCKQAIELAGQINDYESKARALLKLSPSYVTKGKLGKAGSLIKEALAIYKDLGNKKGIADSLNQLGMLYVNMDYQHIAQKYLLKALKIRQKLGEKEPLYYSNLYLGLLYFSLENFSRAMIYFRRAMTLATQLGNEKKIMGVAYYTGVCQLKMNRPAKALDHLEHSLSLANKNRLQYFIASSLNWIGNIYARQGKYTQALKELEKARSIQKKYDYKAKLIYNYQFTANIHLELRQFQRAAHFYYLTIELANQFQDRQIKEQVLKKYAIMHSNSGDYKNALLYYKKHVENRKLYLNESRMKQISEMEIQFESEKRLKEIELLKREGKIQQITRNTTLIILFLLIIILILVFKKYLYLLAFWKTKKFIGHYRIINNIGSGGMGTVFLAHPISDKKKRVAIKSLRDELMEDDISRRRFKHEGAIIDKLEHPNIVKILERGESEGKIYIAMEYLDGLTLANKIKQDKQLRITTSLSIMEQIASALAFIHAKKVVHRDIKPGNIMLLHGENEDYRVKLLDFGVALTSSHTRLTQSGMLVGTIHYLAPEQITDNSDSSTSDVYAMGVTFYEMVTGKTPFPEDSVTSVIERILDEPPPEPFMHRKDIPGELNRMILSMLDKIPSKRPGAAEVSAILGKIERK